MSRFTIGWYATDCVRHWRPLWDRTPDEIVADGDDRRDIPTSVGPDARGSIRVASP